MTIRKTTHNYVDDLLNFQEDLRLLEMRTALSGLAASGDHRMGKDLKQIGTLSDSDGKVRVKIFDDRVREAYLVFFLFKDPVPDYVVVSQPDQQNYYLLHPDNSIVIPKTDGIDPRTDRLTLTFPVDIFHTGLAALQSEPEGLLIGKYETELSYSYQSATRTLHTELVPGLDRSIPRATKILMLCQDSRNSEVRNTLFPMKNGRAILPLSTGAKPLLTLCLYR